MTTKSERNEFAWLDLLRFAAALLVVAMHVRTSSFQLFAALPDGQKTLWSQCFYMLTRIGNEAVILFFVISGFLVGGQAFQRLAQGRFRPRDFAIDRLTRIMIPLVPALVWTAAGALLLGQMPQPGQFLGNVLGLQGVLTDIFAGNRPLWSLSYEMWFYVLIFSLGGWLMAPIRHWWHGLPLVLVAVVFTELAPTYLFCWLIGAAAFLRRPDRPSLSILLLAILTIAAATAVIEVQYGSASVGTATLRRLHDWMPSQDTGRVLLSASLALLIQQLILRPPSGGGLRRLHQLGTWGARFSFSLYLVHFPLLALLPLLGFHPARQFDLQSLGAFVALLATCLVLGWLFYQLTERHTDACRRWLRRRLGP